ncbi:MAG: GNAT family N-acetyltransferase [Anaerolineae bacterium]|nr:GNAT family N-acetyltransferase [Anaerolineae bacterium]
MSEAKINTQATDLQALDALATMMAEKAAPIRFSVAQTREEREAAYRLRYEALIERGAATPQDFPDGLEHDIHDERALQVIGWDGDAPMATGRIVLPVPELPLPTEEAFGLSIAPRGQVVDIGRYTVAHDYAQKENRYFVGMLGYCWLETRRHGYLHVCGTASAGMLRHYRRLGFIVTELAPPHVYYGEERFPCWYDVVGSVAALIGKWGG